MKEYFNGVRKITEAELLITLTKQAVESGINKQEYFARRYLLFCFLQGYCPEIPAVDAYKIIETVVEGVKDHE